MLNKPPLPFTKGLRPVSYTHLDVYKRQGQFYGDMKAIVKTSHLVQIDYPKFIVHGHKGCLLYTSRCV